MTRFLHRKCRNGQYPRSDVFRTFVRDDLVDWSVSFPDYEPVRYTAPSVIAQPPWADLDFEVDKNALKNVKWNALDNHVDRRSFEGIYIIDDQSGLPMNPFGRTGMRGRGLLGKWGPNHAVDPVATRWKCNEKCEKIFIGGKPVLEFIGIERGDGGGWAIPGGMIDPNEKVNDSLKREFKEEVLDFNSCSPSEKCQISSEIDRIFDDGIPIYSGYVDDPRNTDNSWIETIVMNFHEDDCRHNNPFKNINLKAGDDAKNAKWIQIDSSMGLYANHYHFLRTISERHNAFW